MSLLQVISVAIGSALSLLGIQNIINGIAVSLFFFFGVYMLYEGFFSDGDDGSDE